MTDKERFKNLNTGETYDKELNDDIPAGGRKTCVIECPNCSYPIVAGLDDTTARCPCCNTVVNTANPKPAEDVSQKIADIKTLSAAKAYVEYVFATYDWDAFSRDASAFSIPEIDALLKNMKTTQGDNAETWKLCYVYESKCIEQKVDNIDRILEEIIRKYMAGEDRGSCHNDFDALAESIQILKSRRSEFIDNLNLYLTYALKFGLDQTEYNHLKQKTQKLSKQIDSIALANNLEEHPRIAQEIQKKMTAIKEAYKDKGIDAEEKYRSGIEAYNSGDINAALDNFSCIPEYLDSGEYLNKINSCTVLDNKYFYMNDKVYFYRDGLCHEKATLADYSMPESFNFNDYIGCYGTKFYYVLPEYSDRIFYQYLNLRESTKRGVQMHCVFAYGTLEFETILPSRPDTALYATRYMPVQNAEKAAFIKRTGFKNALKINKKVEYGNNWHDLLALDMKNSKFTLLVEGIHKVVNVVGDIVYYIAPNPEYKKNGVLTGFNGTGLYSYNLATQEIKKLITGDSCIRAINDDQSIIFTRNDHGTKNMTIYTKKNAEDASENVVVRNVYQFYKLIKGRIYYLVGNANIKSLCCVNPDGSNHIEVMKYMMDIIFTSGDWIYVTRGDTNSRYRTLYRIPIDGGTPQKVAFGIKNRDLASRNLLIKQGYLYYTDFNDELCRVRLNGTGKQSLVQGVGKILLIKYGKVFYLSYDGSDGGKRIISLYDMEMDGSNRRKLIYNVEDIENVDDGNLIYVREEHYDSKRELYSQITDPKLNKLIDKIYRKYAKKRKFPDSDFRTISLYNCETGETEQLAYDLMYPTKKALKLEKKEVLRR